MKKTIIYGCPVIVGSAIGAAIYYKTKKEQEKAKKERRHIPYGPYEAVIKRPLDIILSGIALVVLSPVMLVTAVLIKFRLGAPILFKQKRPGRDGVPFYILKFRSMLDKKDRDGNALPDEERLTEFGKKLRSTSLDELPELFNILKGDMAVVGPRPLLMEYLSKYNSWQQRRHDVLPGLTSLSASRKRNLASWEERFQDDVKYADKITFLGDMKIIFDTMVIVFKREGIHSKTSVTMEYFQGDKQVI